MRRIGGERSCAAAWVEAKSELRENFNTISNRDEREVEGEKTGIGNMKRKRERDMRHNQRPCSVVLCESHLLPEDKPTANRAESWSTL